MAKFYRRFIRINDEFISSPRFTKKSDADEWFHQMRRKKQFVRDGIAMPKDEQSGLSFIEYARIWFKRREKNFPKSTTSGDNQRLRDYLLPLLSEVPISSITTVQVKSVLNKIMEPGFKKDSKGRDIALSTVTRDKIKALMSAIFSDALNEDPPVVTLNPVHGIKFSEKRKGKKKPRVLANKDECLKFIAAAKEIGEFEFVVASIFLMTGVRKQELIALRWSCIDFDENLITVREKYEQVSGKILSGTKAGENMERSIPVSRELLKILKDHKKRSKFTRDDDFVLTNDRGHHHHARKISDVVMGIREKAQVDISAHGLRHTFGREFALNTGNIKALQAILGHATSSTTDLYSDLSGSRISGFGEAVSFSNVVKRSGK